MTVEIAQPQTGQLPKVKGPGINDRDIINDMLMQEKYLTAGFNTGLNEMQNPKLHETVQGILSDLHNQQFRLFEMMYSKGWYKMKAADEQEIAQTHKQFKNYESQFPSFD